MDGAGATNLWTANRRQELRLRFRLEGTREIALTGLLCGRLTQVVEILDAFLGKESCL